MKRNHTLRPGLPDRTLNRNLIGHPSGSDKIALNERDAMLQREFVDLLTIDNRTRLLAGSRQRAWPMGTAPEVAGSSAVPQFAGDVPRVPDAVQRVSGAPLIRDRHSP
jgi:hypothetical protein